MHSAVNAHATHSLAKVLLLWCSGSPTSKGSQEVAPSSLWLLPLLGFSLQWDAKLPCSSCIGLPYLHSHHFFFFFFFGQNIGCAGSLWQHPGFLEVVHGLQRMWAQLRHMSLVAMCTWDIGLPGRRSGQESTCQCRRCKRCGFDSWVWKIPWRRKLQPAPVLLPGKFHGQRSLVSYSPGWAHVYTDTHMWDISSPTRDWTHVSCVERQIFNHGPLGSLSLSLLVQTLADRLNVTTP